jgi:hypothetical protein
MSSSRRKRPITASNSARFSLALGGALAVLLGSCRGAAREPFLTYFNGDQGLSVRYPSSWKTEQAQQEGVWYRYFLAPPAGPQRKPPISVTLLAGPYSGGVEEYAQLYLAGNTVSSSRDEERQGAQGKSYVFSSADGATRHSLLLFKDESRVFGLYSQGETPAFARSQAILDEMARSLTLERASSYRDVRDRKFAFAVRIPPSWAESRRFAGPKTLLLQFTSPAIGADKGGETVHASLTLTVEDIGSEGNVDSYYEDVRRKLGSAFEVVGHQRWRDGYSDVMAAETSMAVSRVKRFYRAAGGRGYSLAFEAREDVYFRVARWCDLIAGTLEIGPELNRN